MRILVIGAGGMLGYITYQYLKEQGYQVTGITRTKEYSDMLRMDVTDISVIRPFLEKTHFDAIVNCAALLVKVCEERKSDAIKLNTWFPHFLGEFCQQSQTYLIQVSTDAVFSGKRGKYREDSPCDPDSFYGKSKLLGEISDDYALTVRSAFWGADINQSGNGLFQWFVRQKGPIQGYTKALFNGVSNLEFAKFTDLSLKNRWTGIYHLCATDIISKFDFLVLQRHTFLKKTEIIANSQVAVDRSLVCGRSDINHHQKEFKQMMIELKEWLSTKGEFSI